MYLQRWSSDRALWQMSPTFFIRWISLISSFELNMRYFFDYKSIKNLIISNLLHIMIYFIDSMLSKEISLKWLRIFSWLSIIWRQNQFYFVEFLILFLCAVIQKSFKLYVELTVFCRLTIAAGYFKKIIINVFVLKFFDHRLWFIAYDS